MHLIPKRPCGPGGQEEKRMFEPLSGARPGHEAGATVRAALLDRAPSCAESPFSVSFYDPI